MAPYLGHHQAPWKCMYCTRFFKTIDHYLVHIRHHKRWIHPTRFRPTCTVGHHAIEQSQKLTQDKIQKLTQARQNRKQDILLKGNRNGKKGRGNTTESGSNERSVISHSVSQSGYNDGSQNGRRKKQKRQTCRSRQSEDINVLQLRVGDVLEDLLNTGSFFMDDEYPKIVLIKVNIQNAGNQVLFKEPLFDKTMTSERQSKIQDEKVLKQKKHVQSDKMVVSSQAKSKTLGSKQFKIQYEKIRKRKNCAQRGKKVVSSQAKFKTSESMQSKIHNEKGRKRKKHVLSSQVKSKTLKSNTQFDAKNLKHKDDFNKIDKSAGETSKVETVNVNKRKRIAYSYKMCQDDHVTGLCGTPGIKVTRKQTFSQSFDELFKGRHTGKSSTLEMSKFSDSKVISDIYRNRTRFSKIKGRLGKEQQLDNEQVTLSSGRHRPTKCVERKRTAGRIKQHRKSKVIDHTKEVTSVSRKMTHGVIHAEYEETKSFKCKHCKKCFLYHSNKTAHEVKHTKEKHFWCQICRKNFSRLGDKKRHEDVVHSESKPFKCKLCSKVFKSKANKSDHEKSHSEKKPYQCTFCNIRFCYSSGKSRHELLMHKSKQSYNCKLCKKVFTRPDSVTEHERRVHAKERPYRCDICQTDFFDRSLLRRHEKLHGDKENKDHKCSYCDARFITRFHKVVHERTHTKEKPLQCKTCKKSFSDPSNLRAHERLHTDKKPYQCSICKKSFASSSYKYHHEKIHSDKKSSQCRFCGKRFLRPSSKNRHELIHSENKVYIRGPYKNNLGADMFKSKCNKFQNERMSAEQGVRPRKARNDRSRVIAVKKQGRIKHIK